MARWTEETTEGFTAEELDTLNAAQARLEADYPDLDPQNIADRLNNAWVPGIGVDDLVAAI